jgi:hypothetical protein
MSAHRMKVLEISDANLQGSSDTAAGLVREISMCILEWELGYCAK